MKKTRKPRLGLNKTTIAAIGEAKQAGIIGGTQSTCTGPACPYTPAYTKDTTCTLCYTGCGTC